MTTPEKRKHNRVKRPFLARMRPYREVEDPAKPVKWDIVTIKDLSASGVAFNYTKIFPEGTKLEFYFPLPVTAEPLYCIGEVCRIDGSVGGNTPRISVHRVAVRFTEITEARQEILEQFLKKQ